MWFAKFNFIFAKLCKSILLFGYCQVNFTNISLVHIAKLLKFLITKAMFPKQSQSSINNTKLPNCQVHFTLWTAQMEFQTAHKLINFLGYFKMPDFFNFFFPV